MTGRVSPSSRGSRAGAHAFSPPPGNFGPKIVGDYPPFAHGAAGGVHQIRSRPQLPQHLGVDQGARLGVERRVQRDHVGLAEESLEVGALDVGRKVAVDEIGIAGDDPLENVARDVRHALADAPEAHDAERHLACAAQLAG